jgi:glycerol-3-phosphate acyltransferase PlsX
MGSVVRIALDAMGGDHGPSVVVPGASLALRQHADLSFLFFGDGELIAPLLAADPKLAARSSVRHTNVAIKMDDRPSQALRYGRRTSSMWLALDAVHKGEADAAVSAGNTGALMAMAKFCIKNMPGIARPAIAAIWPNVHGESIVLDVGASIGADPERLVELAIMGSAMARIVLKVDVPSVGLLNVGVEEIKGLDNIKTAGRVLRDLTLPNFAYHGFVEGDDIGKGTVNVVVTEGFAGNIALKTAEGTAKQMAQYLREELGRGVMSKIGYFLARRAFEALRRKMDPRRSNGGVFLGLDGVVIKSHGGTDAFGYAGAIEIGYDMARQELLTKIKRSLAASHSEGDAAAARSVAQPL